MSSKIKGIVVEIGGDTSGLQNALKRVNSVTSSLSKELRGINSLLKLDPKNTDLLRQKEKLLNDEIEVTNSKLQELKKHQEDITSSGKTLSKEQQENYRALQREIVATEQKLKTLKAENNKWIQTGKLWQDYGEKISGVGNKISSLGDKLTKIATTTGLLLGGTAIKSAMDFETAFAGVKKTVDGTPEQLNAIKKGIKDMSKELPSTTTEISAVAEAAGQLGIQTDNIIDFTKVMIDLGNSTNLSAEEGASALAKFANVTKMSAEDYSKLGSTIVALGNNSATTEADIVSMATKLASTGDLAGLSQAEILSLAASMSSVGIEAEAGGSAMSKLLKKIQVATETGNKDLKDFAKVAGMTTSDFKTYFQKDAVGALSKFIGGLNDTERNGKSAISVLNDMNLKEVRLSNTILALANSGNLMNDTIELGNEAWKSNTALSKEASQRYETLESKIAMTKNNASAMAISLGEKLAPTIEKILVKVNEFIDKISNLSEEEATNIIKMGLIVTAAGPVIKVLGSLTSGVGKVIKGIGNFSEAIGVMQTGVASSKTSVNVLAKLLSGLTSPAGIATLAIGGVVTAIALIAKAEQEAEQATKEAFENMGNSATEYVNGINTAKSHLDEFNRTLFVTAEEQKELEDEMKNVQDGITSICKTATEERRKYTDEEIKKLDEYFVKLRELNQRELEIEAEIAKAISQQAKMTAETFEGSLQEYKLQSQEWIKTAEEQKEKEIKLINTRTTEGIALLNQRYKTEEEQQSEAYKKEYEKIIEQKNKNIEQVNAEIAEVTKKYAEGYLERAKQNDGFYKTLQEYNEKVEKEKEKHESNIKRIEDNAFLDSSNKISAKITENQRYEKETKKIWQDMYKDMDKSQEEQLGVWLALVSQTEVYGGKIDEETRTIVDEIIESYDKMPEETREAMKNAMNPMLDEMERKEPSLFTKATSIANGILNRLKSAFNIHSPSKETRGIFQNVMRGAELGLEDERKKLAEKIDKISKDTLSRFDVSKMNFNNEFKNKIIDATKTIFTTPQITFNVQKMNEENLKQCFNYINRRFGSAY